MLPFQTLTIKSFDGVDLVADVWNPSANKTLLLLPAGAEVRSVWRPVVEQLSTEVRARWRIVAADHRGHGDSGRSDIYRFDQFCNDLRHWIRELNATSLVIAGGSIGGAMGMVMAGEGAAIDGVVLLDVPTVPRLERVLVERSRIKNAQNVAHAAMHSIDPKFIGTGFIENIFEDSDRWRRAAVQLRIPTLLIAGSRGVVGSEQSGKYHEHIPHGEFAILKTGHLVAREDPHGVALLLSRFLSVHFQAD